LLRSTRGAGAWFPARIIMFEEAGEEGPTRMT
jgi:hypothetical protein